jgi:CHRD domain
MRRVRHLVAVGAVAIGAVAIGDASPASAERRALSAILEGENEVPPADPDGFGLAGVLINTETDRICYALAVRNVDAVIAAHIHSGVAGVNGGIVVELRAPTRGFSAACTTSAQADAIAADPSAYYVNVHSEEHPMGAVRGQLH